MPALGLTKAACPAQVGLSLERLERPMALDSILRVASVYRLHYRYLLRPIFYGAIVAPIAS